MSRVTISVRKVKNAAFKRNYLVKVISLLLDVVRVKRGRVVKARDLRLIGVKDHWLETQVGRVLSWLAKEGYAIRLNNSRPVRYRLSPIIIEIAKTCRVNGDVLPCRRVSCKFTFICPLRRLLGEDQ